MAILNRQQVREVDRRAIAEYGMNGLVLMENAGRGVADVLCRLIELQGRGVGSVSIVCGKGNNGGDGFVIARHVDFRGINVKVLLLANPNELTGDAAANFAIIQKAGLSIEVFNAPLDAARFDAALAGSAWLVDAILGTGATGEPKSPLAEAIELMNNSGKPIVAVDLPSGLDCDSGVPSAHTIRAAHTCTFVAAKPGFLLDAAKPYVGQMHMLDIGVPRKLLKEIEVTALQTS
jgi:NAD(P)H-hydrate epimerase